MNLGTKTAERLYELNVSVLPFDQWVYDVINGIENDKLKVFDPSADANALNCVFDETGALLIDAGQTVTVSICEWLCLACQLIRWENNEIDQKNHSDACLAWYKHNGAEVIFPPHAEFKPLGTEAFNGEIVISRNIRNECLSNCNQEKLENKFKCIVSHELVHAFDLMIFLVPAFMDWDAFWENILDEGGSCDIAVSRYHDRSTFIDSYGQENELAMIRSYWPSKAEQWVEALRGE